MRSWARRRASAARRRFARALKIAAPTLLVTGAIVATTVRAGTAAVATPRSFVLVTFDTTRADHVGAYGARDAHTPTLDDLARRGAVFERAYAVAPVTLPAHASMLTGLYPPAHGVRDNGIHALPASATTLAEELHRRGYRTAAFVSAAVLARRFGLEQGFDVYDDDLAQGRPKEPRMVAERGGDVTVSAALRWLDDLPTGGTLTAPFFLWVHLFDPHAPYAPPAPWSTRFPDRPYDGEIAFADAELARLLAHPRLSGGATTSDPLIMTIADHGESLGEHGEASHGMLAYDATLRVPWIVAGAGVRAGARIAEPVSQVDLYPTALALLEAGDDTARVDGTNLIARLRGSPTTVDRAQRDAADAGGDRVIYGETRVALYAYGWSALRTAIAGRWKLIEAPAPELYDVIADPHETRDVYRSEGERAARLTRELIARFGDAGAAPREARAAPDEASDAALRSLGYLGGRAAPRTAGAPRDPKDLMDVHRALERAEGLFHARDFAGSLRELRAVLDRDPDNLAALEDSAVALTELGRLDSAESALQRALALAPRRASLELVMAQLQGARGNWTAALARAEVAAALAPDDPAAPAVRAQALARLGRTDEAAAVLDRALTVSPGDSLLVVRRVEIVDLPARRFTAAERSLRAAVDQQPYLAAAWRALGRVREAAGRADDAAAAYVEGLRYQPRDPTLHAALGLLLVESDAKTARRHLEEAIELSSSPAPEVRNALGDLMAAAGDAAGATAQWTAVVAGTASTTVAADRHQRAIALRALGRRDEAQSEWRALVATTPDYAPGWQGLAAAALDRRAWADARTAARRAVDIDSTLATAWNTLAIATEELDGKAAAVPLYERALEEQAGYWQANVNLGYALRDLGRAADAARAFEAVLALVPDHAKSHYELGLLCAGPLADAARARDHLTTALRLDPASPRAAQARAALGRLPAG